MELRNYQKALIDKIRKAGTRRVCSVLPCGGGKTFIMGKIIEGAVAKGNKVLFLVHRNELIEQARKSFSSIGIEMKIYQGNETVENSDMVILSTIQTMASRMPSFIRNIKIIMIDEAHHAKSETYGKVLSVNPSAFVYGFTATPHRLDNKPLGDVFNALAESVSVRWLIDNGYLADYDYYAPPYGFMEDKRKIVDGIVEKYRKYADGKKTIVYAYSVDYARQIEKKFTNAGIPAASIDCKMPKKKRDEIIEDFRNGKIRVIVNVDILSEGFDVPDCECVMICDATASLTLHIQQTMRCMRPKGDKRGIIIDMVGNVYLHGLPDDKHEWSLTTDYKPSNKKKSETKIKTCPDCYAVLPSISKKCPMCGHDFTEEIKRREMEEKAAELEKIKAENIKKQKREDKKTIHSVADLWTYAKKYNYKAGWVYYQCKIRGWRL